MFEFQRINMEMDDEDGCMLTAGWLVGQQKNLHRQLKLQFTGYEAV
jgi:hypothetical protein